MTKSKLVGDLEAAALANPQDLLGAHASKRRGRPGVQVTSWHPEATAAQLLLHEGGEHSMQVLRPGLFEAWLPDATLPLRYRLRLHFEDGAHWECEDPYRFPSTLGEVDLHLFAEGTHRRLWKVLGANPGRIDGVDGVAFAVWAPRATRVSVVGDFCHWDGRVLPMCHRGGPGVFELFVPGLAPGANYKFEIRTAEGAIRLKSDPFARRMELPPGSASIVDASNYAWNDDDWMAARRHGDPRRAPLAVYEVHLGSWMRVPEDGDRPLSYREIAPRLAAHVKQLGMTHIELMPVTEYPFDDSWGYQVSGYFAPTSRYGAPDDLRHFIDHCHAQGLGVILDWVPAHFPRDDFALRRFDGAPLYEYADPLLGEHPDWGTLIFDYGRNEVRNFLMASALYWIDEFHIDGLRVDAVASMLYRDYSREAGGWSPNVHGGNENLEAIDFLRGLNDALAEEHPGCISVAEESTSWPGVTAPTHDGGLGFTFKWNMGWMNDTLAYFARDSAHRLYHHDELTFAAVYEHSERFIMPLSHDEVVHGKRSLLEKMPGDRWQKLANLRLLLAYQWTRPGGKLIFMGTELAPHREWTHRESLDWHLADDPDRQGLQQLFRDLGQLYREHPCLWLDDTEASSFRWVDCSDRTQSVVSYLRSNDSDDLLVILNATPVPRDDYRVGVPRPGPWRLQLSTDAPGYGGSDYAPGLTFSSEPIPYHGLPDSLALRLPPLAGLVLIPGD
jgi:1,4-alpha-glucan branching enzyme